MTKGFLDKILNISCAITVVIVLLAGSYVSANPICENFFSPSGQELANQLLTKISQSNNRSFPIHTSDGQTLLNILSDIIPNNANDRQFLVESLYGIRISNEMDYSLSGSDIFTYNLLDRLYMMGLLADKNEAGNFKITEVFDFKPGVPVSNKALNKLSENDRLELIHLVSIIAKDFPIQYHLLPAQQVLALLSKGLPISPEVRQEKVNISFGVNFAISISYDGSNKIFAYNLLNALSAHGLLDSKNQNGQLLILEILD